LKLHLRDKDKKINKINTRVGDVGWDEAWRQTSRSPGLNARLTWPLLLQANQLGCCLSDKDSLVAWDYWNRVTVFFT